MRIAIISDVHANLSALKAVLTEIGSRHVDKYVCVGDLVNYGMRPNEVIDVMRDIDDLFLAKIWGNHEKALMDSDTTRFSTDRGRAILHYTQSILSERSFDYINEKMDNAGMCTMELDGKRFLLVHGVLGDPFWGKFSPDELNREEYAPYDYVITGHSHVPHYYEVLFKADSPETRNKKRTVFINPGSVGQPRNMNPFAQFGVLDTSTFEYNQICVPYDIRTEQSLYNGEVDDFYRNRLALGI